MKTTDVKVRVGDWVEVKSPREIAQTLDGNGALDGLPFMPEMIEFCGHRLRVTRWAEKTCVEYEGGVYKIRAFHKNDVVILDAPRCSGAAHDGCGRACTFFWKTSWLRAVKSDRSAATVEPSEPEDLRAATRTITTGGRYICQSTELDKATHPLSRFSVVLKCFADIRSGSRGLLEMAWMVVVPIWKYFIAPRYERPLPAGTLKRTPTATLGLQPGDVVRIKTEKEIVGTLDPLSRNRGLSCDRGMRTFCGGEYRVRNRLDRMIAEPTGRMRTVENTVILEGLNCLCWWNHVGGCPRKEYMYWREVWLERCGGNGHQVDTP
jgi:hypothetical protein